MTAGWALWFMSLFLPAIPSTLLGEWAQQVQYRSMFEFSFGALMVLFIPGMGGPGIHDLVARGAVASNLLMIGTAATLFIRWEFFISVVMVLMLAATGVNGIVYFIYGEWIPGIGFYVWVLSFAIVTVGLDLRRRRLAQTVDLIRS